MGYSFDLGIADYVAMNMHRCNGIKGYFAATVPSAGVAFMGAFFFLVMIGHMVPDWAFLAAGAMALVYFVVSPFFWRSRHRVRLRKYYGNTPFDQLLGPHTLSIGPEGVESTGPYHRTLRAWPSVTGACVTAEQTLIYTIFGNVYIIPGRAMNGLAEVRGVLQAYLPANVIRDA